MKIKDHTKEEDIFTCVVGEKDDDTDLDMDADANRIVDDTQMLLL